MVQMYKLSVTFGQIFKCCELFTSIHTSTVPCTDTLINLIRNWSKNDNNTEISKNSSGDLLILYYHSHP